VVNAVKGTEEGQVWVPAIFVMDVPSFVTGDEWSD
jgi:hypothetical protein